MFALHSQFGPGELEGRPILPPDWTLIEILSVASNRKTVLKWIGKYVAYLTVRSQRLSRRKERSHESSRYGIRYPDRDSSSGLPEYEAESLTTLPAR
jgi:hypothetical protein